MAVDQNNVYALNIKGDVIHASESASGRRGYFCLGCKKEMQAVRSKDKTIIDYFRHDAKYVDQESKCTYHDETYRHKLAKEILQRLKRIKVPTLFKYPPKGEDGGKMLLLQSRFVEAHRVAVEINFYEGENGEIRFGVEPPGAERYFLVRPDVTFFNELTEPILFIEIVATHGIKTEKLLKFKRLGVDTIQFTVPQDSPENIEKAFHSTDRTKWIYNNVEQNTEYLSPSNSIGARISPIDEFQRTLQEESLRCRRTQIGNVVRAIKRCLASEQYRELESKFRVEISRVEQITDGIRARFQQLQAECDNQVESRFSVEIASVSAEEEKIRELEISFQGDRSELEGRYHRKTEEIKRANDKLDERIQEGTRRNTDNGESFDIVTQRFREDQTRLLRLIKETRERINGFANARSSIPERFAELRTELKRKYQHLEEGERAEIQRITESTNEQPEILATNEAHLRREFEELRTGTANTIKGRNINGDSELSERITRTLQTRGLLVNFEQAIGNLKRNRTAWECFKSGAYKNWQN